MESSGHEIAVSVIIAARNAQSSLPALLAALNAQTIGRDRMEVIVVDDCSTDATAEVARSHGARVITAACRGGAYAARNLGLAQATGRVMAFTDADCLPAPDWLQRGAEAVDDSYALVAGRIDVPLSPRPSIAELLDTGGAFDQSRTVAESGHGVTANLFVRRDVFETAGPFNDKVISGGDREFCLRAGDRGFRIRYAGDAVVMHEPRRSLRELARKAYRYGLGRAQMWRHGTVEVARRPPLWSSVSAYLPKLGQLEVSRLRPHGYTPSGRERVVMRVADYLFQRLPMLAGNIHGTLRLAARNGGVPRF